LLFDRIERAHSPLGDLEEESKSKGKSFLRMSRASIHVGNLPRDVRESELDDLFYKFGRISRIEVVRKQGSNAAFAFIGFNDYRDAEDAIRGRDGILFGGGRILVEMSKDSRRGDRDRDRDGDRVRDRNRDRDPPKVRERKPSELPSRTQFGIHVTGFRGNTRWREIKELFTAEVGPVGFADIPRGKDFAVVEFASEEHVALAIEKMHGADFKGSKLDVTRRPARAAGDSSSSSSKAEAAAAGGGADASAGAGAEETDRHERGDGRRSRSGSRDSR
jgi:RNA recognition motif-containing protein